MITDGQRLAADVGLEHATLSSLLFLLTLPSTAPPGDNSHTGDRSLTRTHCTDSRTRRTPKLSLDCSTLPVDPEDLCCGGGPCSTASSAPCWCFPCLPQEMYFHTPQCRETSQADKVIKVYKPAADFN